MNPCTMPQKNVCYDAQPGPEMRDGLKVEHMLTELAKAADDLSMFCSERLSCLLPPEPPSANAPAAQYESMCPLMSAYRDRIESVSAALRRVRYMLDRVQV